MRVLIAGCGDVGIALGHRLGEAGHDVFGLRRRTARLPATIRPIRGDLGDPGSLEEAAEVAPEVVVYTAAADERSPLAYRRAYLEGVENLHRALGERERPPKRFVFASSTAVYGQRDGEWVDEDSPTEPRSETARILLEAERLVLARDVRGVVVRLSGIYGPGRMRLVDAVRSGRAAVPDGPPVFTNRIHRDDAAGALAHVVSIEDPLPVYVASDHDPADRATVLRWLAERLRVPPPATEPADPERGRNKRCRNDRLVASGYRFRYRTFREGYRAVLDEAAE